MQIGCCGDAGMLGWEGSYSMIVLIQAANNRCLLGRMCRLPCRRLYWLLPSVHACCQHMRPRGVMLCSSCTCAGRPTLPCAEACACIMLSLVSCPCELNAL